MSNPQVNFSALQGAGPTGQLLAKDLAAFARVPGAVAPNSIRRLQEVSNNYTKLTPEAAYQLLNPVEFAQEVEEAHLKQLNRLVFWRNVFSILPLVTTWLALFDAARGYAADPNAIKIPEGANAPNSFFVLWQSSFNGHSVLNFQSTALIDVVWLSLFLIFTLLVQQREHQAQVAANEISATYQELAMRLIGVVANRGSLQLGANADPLTLVATINEAINRAIETSREITDDAKNALGVMQQSVQALVTDLAAKLVAVEQQMHGLATASATLGTETGKLSQGAADLVTNSTRFIQAGQSFDQHVTELKQTEQTLTSSLTGITGGVTSAVQGMTTATTSSQQLTATLRGEVQQISALLTQTAQQLGATIAQMSSDINTNVSGGAQNLTNAQKQLSQTENALRTASDQMERAAIQIANAAVYFESAIRGGGGGLFMGGGGGGSLLDLLFRRSARRSRTQGGVTP